jgi:hypothetical protein
MAINDIQQSDNNVRVDSVNTKSILPSSLSVSASRTRTPLSIVVGEPIDNGNERENSDRKSGGSMTPSQGKSGSYDLSPTGHTCGDSKDLSGQILRVIWQAWSNSSKTTSLSSDPEVTSMRALSRTRLVSGFAS